MNLKDIINETLDPATAKTAAAVIKKYKDRALQDKSPDADILGKVEADLLSNQQPQQTQQVQQPQQATQQQGAVQQ